MCGAGTPLLNWSSGIVMVALYSVCVTFAYCERPWASRLRESISMAIIGEVIVSVPKVATGGGPVGVIVVPELLQRLPPAALTGQYCRRTPSTWIAQNPNWLAVVAGALLEHNGDPRNSAQSPVVTGRPAPTEESLLLEQDE